MCYELKKPFSDIDRAYFVTEYNHNKNLRLEDTEMFLFALEDNEIMGEKDIEIIVIDYDEDGNPIGEHTETITIPYPVVDPDYDEKALAKAQTAKYEEAKTKAYLYLESGDALYEFEEGKHIEATDGNIGKFTAYALGFMAGSTTPVVWSTKEDETVTLDAEQVTDILQGLGSVQAQVWTVKFTDYITAIQEAETIEEVNAITIDYSEN